MAITAERLRPKDVTVNPIFCQNLSVYEYAQQFVKDKVVLDLGCGEGYGTALLAKSAEKIVGIDYSKEAINRANKNYKSHNIEFICKDINHLKLPEESIDVICAFQLIEHLSRPDIFLSKIEFLLKPNGLFFLSTPNKKASIIEHPYHFREYDRGELNSMLRKYFSKVDVLGLQFSQKVKEYRQKRKRESQNLLKFDPLKLHRLLPRFVRQRLFDLIAARLSEKLYLEDTALIQDITSRDYWVSKEDIDSAIDLVCACWK